MVGECPSLEAVLKLVNKAADELPELLKAKDKAKGEHLLDGLVDAVSRLTDWAEEVRVAAAKARWEEGLAGIGAMVIRR